MTALNLSARGGGQVRANDGAGALTLDIGRDDVAGRLSRFLAVYGRTVGLLARSGTHVDHVDLRYRNGFAARLPEFREKPRKRS